VLCGATTLYSAPITLVFHSPALGPSDHTVTTNFLSRKFVYMPLTLCETTPQRAAGFVRVLYRAGMAEFTLNGEIVSVADHHDHLLTALRDELGVLSPKDGCSPTGQCGCCTVIVDGKARVACQTSLEKTEGTEVLTLEGLGDDERDLMVANFAAHGALQCGFCTPGIVMRT